MGLFKNFVSQTRKPEGFLGKMMVNGMNGGHAKMADWSMSHLRNIVPKEILEVGCGGGRNAHELMQKYPSCKVTAIDYSDVSVERAAAYNTDMIQIGRCKVLKGDVSDLNMVTGDKVEYKISKCMYVEMFETYGIRPLCKIFCNTDTRAYSGLTRHVEFIRHSDLSDGPSCHDEVIRKC